MADLDFQYSGDRMRACLRIRGATHGERIVLATLAWYDGPGGCHPSYDALQDDTRMSRYAVARHLKALEEKGLITRKHRFQATNEYRILYEFF